MNGTDSTAGRLKREEVKYLSFEGGGGKGFAFVGALQALEVLNLLQYTTIEAPQRSSRVHWMPQNISNTQLLSTTGPIKGISGSSAGAITALLLSCGYSARDILTIMTSKSFDFDTFFEPPRPRVVPRIQTNRTSIDYSGVEAVPPKPGGESSDNPWLQQLILGILQSPFFGIQSSATQLANSVKLAWPRFLEIARVFLELAAKAGADVPTAVRVLLAHFNDYVEFLDKDLGLFPGYAARKFFAEIIAHKMPNGFNATFEDHYNFFKIKLVVTGTNLETGKSGVFSPDTTPNFPVADAVRISMSLPLAYKPIKIRTEHFPDGYLPSWVIGLWVDGGYLNNLPLHVFDLEKGKNPKTLGLRLDLDPTRKSIDSFGQLLTIWPLTFGFGGTGEAYISPSLRNHGQTIELNTEGLSLLKFSPDPATVKSVSERGFNTVLDYFGVTERSRVEFSDTEAGINEMLEALESGRNQ